MTDEHVTSALRQEGPQQELQALVNTLRDLLDGFDYEVMNGVICTPPSSIHGGIGWNDEPSRLWCSRCRARWATLRSLPRLFSAALSASRTAQAPQQEGEPIEHFWTAVERGWDIEPRAYFEKEAVAMGFKSPVEMAVHWMWKRHAKDWPNEELASAQARIRVLETSVDYLRYLVDHPVTPAVPQQEKADIQYDTIIACARYLDANYGDEAMEFSSALASQHWGPVVKASASDPPVAPAEGEHNRP